MSARYTMLRFISNYLPFFFILVFFLSCQKQAAPEKLPAKEPLAKAAVAADLVISGAETEVDLKRYEDCVLIYALNGSPMSERALANARFQRDEASRCFQRWFLVDMLGKKSVSMSEPLRRQALERALKANDSVSKQALAVKLKIDEERLDRVIGLSLVEEQMQQYLVSQWSESERERVFAREHRRFDFEFASFDNHPSQEQLEGYVAANKPIIAAHYEKWAGVYLTRPSVRLARFSFPLSKSEQAEELAGRFRELVLDKALVDAESSCKEDVNCVCLTCGGNAIREESSDANQWAFTQAVGAWSNVEKRSQAYEVSKILAFEAPRQRMLDEDLAREIATEFLLKEPNFEQTEKLKMGLSHAGEVDFDALSRSLGGEYVHPQKDYYYRLRGAGVPEELWKVLGETKAHEIGFFSNPVVVATKFYVFRVIQIEDSTVKDFQDLSEAYFKRVSTDPERQEVKKYLEDNLPRLTQLNVKVLRAHYGSLQEDGSIIRSFDN